MLRLRSVAGAVAVVTLVVLGMISGGPSGSVTAASAAATAGCGKAPTLTSGTKTIQSGGQNRSYILRVPENYDPNRPYRLIFGFHWNGGSANDVDSGGTSGYPWSYYGIRALSNNSAIFVAPQGLNAGWANTNNRDLTFVDDMVRTIQNGLCVDTTQLFAMGFSYGGGMSYSIACSRASVFRAVAVYAGGQLSGCSGGTDPIAYIGIHGLRDNVLNISQGRALRDRFVRNNGCTPQNPPEPAAGSLTHVVTAYSGCRAGYPVVWGAFDGPHAPNAVDGTADGYAPGEKSWTRQVVWDFFAQFQSGTNPTPTPTTTTPPVGSQQNVTIVGNQSNRCVDVPGAVTTNGTQANLWDCNGRTNQRWTYTSGKQVTVYGNKCLDASGRGTANGTAAIIWDCNGQNNQQWNVNSNGTITSVLSGLCLDASALGTANGTKVQLWQCLNGANQKWTTRS